MFITILIPSAFVSKIEGVPWTGCMDWGRVINEKYRVVNVVFLLEHDKKW